MKFGLLDALKQHVPCRTNEDILSLNYKQNLSYRQYSWLTVVTLQEKEQIGENTQKTFDDSGSCLWVDQSRYRLL